ncbi:MAG: amino acid adenylation domain-containing protein [Acidobacteria bacterium]|nr:amino acid adenylation domain-containing protein [Acidobacteriota bacterium]
MDEATQLLQALAQLGVKLAVENGQLKMSAAKGVLTGELRSRIVASRDEILRRLQEQKGETPRVTADPLGDLVPFPLSDLQLGFYIANDPYMEYHVRPHLYMELERGAFDVSAYEAAWNKALRRRRRELCIVNGDIELELLQEAPQIKCKVYDGRNLPSGDAAALRASVREEMMRRELRLDSWPWLDLRVSLWREGGEERARIHYNHNNFFIDGFGANQLLTEVETYYRSPEVSNAPLELSFRDAVLALERLAASAAGEAARSYWFSRLPGLPPPPSLPQKAGLNRRCRSRLRGRSGALESGPWAAFKSHASALGLTPSNALIAAYSYVVATWSNSDHFILSQMMTRRFAELHPDFTRMLGNFASLYPLEVKLESAAPFADNARRIQSQVLEDLRHLELGGMRVLQELNRLKGSFGSAPSPFVVGSGLFIKPYRKADFSVLETSQTLLDHQFFELADGSLHYVWDLLEEFFPDGMIEAMWEAYQGLLQRLASDGEAWFRRDFDLVSAKDLSERRERNQTARRVASRLLHEPLGEQAATRGDDAVLVSAPEVLSYRDLATWSASLAAELAASGVGRGDLVPVLMDRGQEVLAAVMAVLQTGAAYVPIDPRLPAERLALLLGEAGATVALTQSRYRESIAWPERVTPLAVSYPALNAGRSSAPGEVSPAASDLDLAYVIYTSGSTGRPKGVMIDHRGAWNTIVDINERFGVGPADRIFGVSAFNFDLSVYDLFGTVAAGACLVYPDADSALDPTHWLERVVSERITLWSSVPALMSLLVEAAQRRGASLPSLRLVMLSGDKIPLDLPAAIRQVAPNTELVSLGGGTEGSIWSIFYPIGEVDPGWATIPYGYPMVNQTWEVRDRNGRPCPTWVPGELLIGGVGLAKGYWQDAEKTARSFEPDPLTGERRYRTGDLGRYLPGGCIEWLGRADFQVKIQGHRIELGEIEAVLAEHQAVREAVVAVQESPLGSLRKLVACIVPAGVSQVDVKALQAFLQSRLPAYMVPTVWRVLAQLPLTGNGKVDRKALLQAQLAEGSENRAGGAERREPVAPAGPIESRLQAIWERILGVSPVGVTDDFFELGGQSFDAIRIFALIKEELGTSYSLSDMWRARTIRELAGGIADGTARKDGGRIVPIDARGAGGPLFLVHPAGGSVMTYSRLGRLLDRPLYGIQAIAGLGGPGEARHRQDIVELAGSYVAELRQVQPGGPYSLGGWSSGAMIAFEMAAQLEAAGERVKQLFLLDGPAPVDHGELSDERLLAWFLDDLALGLPIERLQGLELAGLPLAEQLRQASALLLNGQAPALDLESLLANFQIFRDLILAGSRYVPSPVAADLTVVRVEKDVVEEFSSHPHRHENDWGWRGLTRGRVRCMRVPGTHHSFLTEPLVDGWCALLSDAEPALEPAPAISGRT